KVVFIPASGGSPETHQTLDIAARFYGIDLTSISPTAVHDYVSLRSSVSAPTTVAVVVAARALADLSQTAFLSAMASRPGGSAPLLITGLTAETDAGLLKSWSDGAVLGCSRLDGLNRPTYVVAGGADITGPLTRMEYPALNKHPFYLIPGEHSRTQNLLNIRDRGRTYPVFVLASRKDQQLFLDVSVPAPVGATSTDVLSAFTELAPLLMFLKYSAGDRGWHSLHHYANLTIDDPRLQQPYGLFDYERLLSAMQAHRFHTTIAFIPWNYDRNDPRVASLIRKHPDRFSIAIHGDNHDHREFTGYETKPLPVQVAALRQALARMDTFRTLTAIPYDKVMVFPHAIAPENTLQALKDNGYLATVNSSNIPLGSPIPANALFHLRSVTLKFGGIPSLLRYSVAVPVPTYLIGLQTFLDNPLLFYCHHDFFLTGSDAFNKIADDVNTRDPNVQWTSLGDIVRHFYLVKLRDDSDYDVSAYSSEFDLENVAQRKVVFHVRKLEADSRRVASLIVDGDPQPFVSS